jgi:hypothetical protein
MADSSSEHIIRIIVQALNRAGNLGEQIAKDLDKATSAQDKHTKSVKDNDKAIENLRKEYAAFVKEIRDGNKDYDAAREGLARFSSEFDKLSRKQKIGSTLAEDLNKGAVAARNLTQQLKTAHEVESKLAQQAARDRIRQEDERQRITQQTIASEIKEEERGVKARQGLMAELLDAVRQDNEDRIAFNRELTRQEVDEERRRTKARVDESVRSAQQLADISRRQDVTRAAPTIRERISGFFGGGGTDSGPRRFIQDLTGLGRASDTAERRVSRLDRTLERLHGTANKTGFSVAKVDNNLRGLLVVGVIAFSQQMISALTAVASTLFSVAAAAVQAGAALGGAFVAAAAQAVPAIGILVAAFSRVTAVFKAVQLFNKQATRAGRDQASVADAQAAAADRVTSAQEGVASATQRVRDATDALTDARTKAIQNITDLNLAERKASLSRFESQTALRSAISRGDVGALEGLRIQGDESRVQAVRAGSEASKARTQGVEGSDQVRRAVRTLEDANIALGRARREMAAAERAASKAATNVSSADQALKEALAQLTPAELALYRSIRRIQDRFKVLFRPITDIIVRAFTDATDRVGKVMGDARVLGPLRQVAEAIAASIKRITTELTDNRALSFFRDMAKESARNIPLLTSIAIHVSRIFSAIARAASPALRKFLEFLERIATQGEHITNSKSGLSKLQAFFLRGEQYAESIAKLTASIVELFLALSGAGGAESGQSAIDQLTEQVRKATDWVNENRDKVKQFFKDSLEASKAIASAIFAIGKAVVTVFSDDKVKDFANAFKQVLLPALTNTVIALGAITDLLAKFLGLPVIGDVAAMGLSVGLLSKAFSTVGKLLIPLSEGVALFASELPILGRAFRLLAVGIRISAAILSGPWGIAIAAAIAAIVFLNGRFHFIQPTIRTLGHVLEIVLGGAFNALKTVVITFTDIFLGSISSILGGISSLASAAGHIPGIGGAFKGVANFIDDARDKIDGYRESLRSMGEEHKKVPAPIERIQTDVGRLSKRLSTLKEGSDSYRETSIKLRRRQEDLNVAMSQAEQDGKKGARGPRALGRSATSAAEAVDDANKSIVHGYNQLAKQLGGIRKISYSSSGVTIKGGTGSVTADTGDITALGRWMGGFVKRAIGGWMGGQAGGVQGPDDIMVRAGRGEAFLNVPQQGPVEEGLALRSMFMGGPGSLTDLFRQYGGAFASGGRVGGIDLKGAGQGMAKYAIDAMRYGLNVSSGLRPGAITSSGNLSLHSSGRAIDLVGTAVNMLRYARHAVSSYGRQLAELIHTPLGFGIKGGKRVPLSFWGSTVNRDHVGHVHVGGGAGGAGGIAGLVDSITRQKIRGPEGVLRDIAQRAVDRVRRAASDAAGFGGSVGAEPTAGIGRANTSQIRGWIAAGLRLAGQKVTQGSISTLFGRVMQESGGNPRAVNLTDINARRGDPSRGLLQTISATFRRYMVKGHGNVNNPVDNVAAAVRYMLARYGHLVGAGPGGYQTGGFVGRAVTRRGYTAPTLLNTSFKGVLDELKRAQDAIARIQTRGPRFVKDFARSISQITDDGGLLDLAKEAIQRVVDGMALRLRQATFAVTKSGVVVRRLTPAQQNLATISSIDRQRESLQSLSTVAQKQLADIDRRLAVLRQGGVTAKERKAYETLITARRGLVTKIQDLDVAVADAVEARFQAQEQAIQDAIDAIDEKAQKTLTKADLADRVANVLQTVGGTTTQAGFALHGAELQARSGAIIAQRDQLTKAAGIAGALGRQDIVAQLVAKIEELNVQLFENAAAIRSNTVAARQAKIDAITNRGGFLGGVNSGLQNILQTIGATTGVLDIKRIQDLTKQAGEDLIQTGRDLRQQLGETFGVNLLGLSGQGLSDVLSSMNFDQVEASFSLEQRAQFEGLINAIVENAGAVEQNTQSLKDLSSVQQQTFSSSAWQLFRRAIFNGMGGLLPEFRAPLMASGGTILSNGLIFGHSGETIVPANVSRDSTWQGGDTNNIYITSPTEVADPGHLASVLSFRRSLERATR